VAANVNNLQECNSLKEIFSQKEENVWDFRTKLAKV